MTDNGLTAASLAPASEPARTSKRDFKTYLAWITTPVSIVNGGPGLYAPFFGLAPGLLGVYQLDLQVPQSTLPMHSFSPSIEWTETFGNELGLGPIPVR